MDRIWVLVANASRARVYERDPLDARLVESADFVHPQSRQKGQAFEYDRAGHSEHGMGRGSLGRTDYEPPTDVHEREHAKFAHELAQQLGRAVAERRCPGLIVFASNPFFGELKAAFDAATRKALLAAFPSDLTAWERPVLGRRVTEVLEALP
jgi:protein required for attachment to host cells